MTGGRGGNQRPAALEGALPCVPHILSLGKDSPALFVLHLLQDRHDHVKLGPLCGVFVHADLHELTHMGRNAWWDGRPKALQCHLYMKGNTRWVSEHESYVARGLQPSGMGPLAVYLNNWEKPSPLQLSLLPSLPQRVLSPSFQSPCWRGQQRVLPVSPVPREALQNSTCLLSVCLCLQASSAELEGEHLSVPDAYPVLSLPPSTATELPFSTSHTASPSGATQAGAYMRPGHWKENLTSAMLMRAVMSSSI